MSTGLGTARERAPHLTGGLLVGLVVPAAIALFALPGCDRKSEAKSLFSCHCEFLTDTDGSSEQRVDVCAAGHDAAIDAAAGCAQAAAPAPIQGCRCEAASGTCPPDDCKAHEHR